MKNVIRVRRRNPKSTDHIISGLSKMVRQLEAHNVRQAEQANHHRVLAEQARQRAEDSIAEAKRAAAVAERLGALLS